MRVAGETLLNGYVNVSQLKVRDSIDMTGATFVIDDTHAVDQNIKHLTIGNLNVS